MGGSSSPFRAPLAREIILRELLLAFLRPTLFACLSLALFCSLLLSLSLSLFLFLLLSSFFRRFFCRLIYTHVLFDR